MILKLGQFLQCLQMPLIEMADWESALDNSWMRVLVTNLRQWFSSKVDCLNPSGEVACLPWFPLREWGRSPHRTDVYRKLVDKIRVVFDYVPCLGLVNTWVIETKSFCCGLGRLGPQGRWSWSGGRWQTARKRRVLHSRSNLALGPVWSPQPGAPCQPRAPNRVPLSHLPSSPQPCPPVPARRWLITGQGRFPSKKGMTLVHESSVLLDNISTCLLQQALEK